MKKTALTLIIIVLAGVMAYAQTTSVPPLINYQGRLTDNSGIGLTGTKTLEFNIYDAATNGNKIWGPQIFNTVPLVDGYFNVILGTTDSAGRSIADAFSTNTRFLGVTYDAKEIVPRQQILSVPYAMQAQKSQEVHDDKRFSPVGSIIAWHKTIENTPALPDGWVECNGQIINDPASPYNGQNTPNLNNNSNYENRGLFLRGGTNSGTFQNDQLQDHQHEYIRTYTDTNRGTASGHAADNKWAAYITGNPLNCKHGTDETRPVNMSVVWIMRIK